VTAAGPLGARRAALYEPEIDLFFRPEMALEKDPRENQSRSPSKPARFVAHAAALPLGAHLRRVPFEPLGPEDFLLAHEADYVEGFFRGQEPHASANGLAWSREFATTVRYTNGSLVAAVVAALERPSRIALSPTSGFHHAAPEGGSAFCTFSGQVIAALRVFRARGARGAWIDLDGHFGNSIEDSRAFRPELDAAIPAWAHINPAGRHRAYLRDLEERLGVLGERVLSGDIDYVGFAHGADSHEWDDLGVQCTTAEWIAASRLVYGAIDRWSRTLGRALPLVLALFGGYRDDDPDSVLELHAADVSIALSTLAGLDVEHRPKVARRRR
jgi:acetoin utilization deacetylase AcuC-like enzyme